MKLQHTLAGPVHIQGVGLHGGQAASVRLLPAPAGAGLSFIREDLPGCRPIPARYDRVIDTRLATTLGDGAWRVSTVEHLLAALVAEGVDNAEIAVRGEEVPVLDGSAAPWVHQIRAAGRRAQAAPRRTLAVREPVEVREGEKVARLLPGEGLELDATIQFDHPAIGRQQLAVRLHNGNFAHELAWARTFGFLAEVEAMRAAGLGLGGTLESAVVYDASGVINPGGLRSPDEAVRHKLLDMMGDLALAGLPLQARFEAVRPGHALNLSLVRALLETPRAWEIVEG